MAKKILILGVALIMGLGLFSGCGNDGKSISEEPFYSLQAAYDNNWLKKADLKSIANFHSKGNEDALDNEVANDIKTAYLERYPQDGMTADDIVINKYYGNYNDCVVLMLGYWNSAYADVMGSETIAGVKFSYSNSQRILIFKTNR